MLGASVFLALVPATVRALRAVATPRVAAGATTASAPPDLSVWRHVENLNLSHAASLWCEIDPNADFAQGDEIKFKARLQLMKDAVKQRALALQPGTYEQHDINWPTDHVYTTRTALRAWAKAKGWEVPSFLLDPP
jgi:hypothetical protein